MAMLDENATTSQHPRSGNNRTKGESPLLKILE